MTQTEEIIALRAALTDIQTWSNKAVRVCRRDPIEADAWRSIAELAQDALSAPRAEPPPVTPPTKPSLWKRLFS